jgi:hypothetical protein
MATPLELLELELELELDLPLLELELPLELELLVEPFSPAGIQPAVNAAITASDKILSVVFIILIPENSYN